MNSLVATCYLVINTLDNTLDNEKSYTIVITTDHY